MRLRYALIAVAAISCSSPAAELADAAVDAALDAIGPTKDASADDAAPPAPTTVDEVVCDKQYPGVVGVFAEKSYPGRTKEDLARARVVNCNVTNVPTGACGAGLPLVKDGMLFVYCGTDLDGRKVTLVVPPPL